MGFKFLAASDLHGSQRGAANLGALASVHGAGAVTLSGDITHFQLPESLGALLAPVKAEILAVTGNCDTLAVVHALPGVPRVVPLNGNIVRRGGWNFCGYAYNDRSIQEILPIVPKERLILVTHVPARGVNDRTGIGPGGDGRINEWIAENEPALVLSGHIHEARGIERRKKTVFINPGPARDNMAALVVLGEDDVADARLL